MVKHNFKVGDKVRLKPCFVKHFAHLGTRILMVLDLDCGNEYIPVWYEGVVGSYFPLKPCEIEYVSRKGEQLLFDFMAGESRVGGKTTGKEA